MARASSLGGRAHGLAPARRGTYVARVADVLLVSKPVAPPWNDSGKNLVRDLARAMTRHVPHVLVRPGDEPGIPRAVLETVYGRSTGGFAPALADNARVLARLLAGSKLGLWHFFFAPNPRTSMVGRAASRLRRARTVQTVSSAPTPGVDPRGLLFADAVVALSAHTERVLLEAGVARDRVSRIPAAIVPLDATRLAPRAQTREALGIPEDVPLVVFPGDLELSAGAELTLRAVGAITPSRPWLAMACRAKTARAGTAEQRLRESREARALGERVVWTGETRRIHDLLAAADVVALPADTLYAKMDQPLVLLEAMSLERAVVVATGTPAEELAQGGAAIAVAPRAEAVRDAIARLLDHPAERAELGARARARVLAEHAPSTMAARYEALYDRLLG